MTMEEYVNLISSVPPLNYRLLQAILFSLRSNRVFIRKVNANGAVINKSAVTISRPNLPTKNYRGHPWDTHQCCQL